MILQTKDYKTEVAMEQYVNKINTVCFTGHRNIPYKDAVIIPTVLKAKLEELIKRGAVNFRAGGAMGFDTIAALCVLELQEKYPHIKLDLILPCRDQTKLWPKDSITVYHYILSKASCISYTSEHYTAWCMMTRNRKLVDGSQVCIAYLSKSAGGTAYTYDYALKMNLEVINIYETTSRR